MREVILERGIKFTLNREESEGGKPYWLVWVTIDYKEEGPYYAGVTACEMVVNRENRRGYKELRGSHESNGQIDEASYYGGGYG